MTRKILENNQYPPSFYNPIIEETVSKLINPEEKNNEINGDKDSTIQKNQFIQYRGKVTGDYARSLHKINAPVTIVMTLRKMKTVLPSLKPRVDKFLRSGVVYQIQCPCCGASYVGQSRRHLIFREHVRPSSTVGKHAENCQVLSLSIDNDCKIMAASTRGEGYILTLEALWIYELNPKLNTEDEYRSRTLTIKL